MICGMLPDLEHAQIPSQTHHKWYDTILRKKLFSNFLKFFWLEILCFFGLLKPFQDSKWTKISFFFSKSKPLNENRIDSFLIDVPLDLPLAWFGLNTHRKKSYWIWKLVKISLFWVKYVKIQKSNLKLQKSKIFIMDKIFK